MKKKLAVMMGLGLASVGVLSSSAKVAHAADTNVTNKIVMHTATAYDKDGKDTGVTYKAFSYAKIVANPIKIDGSYYYKVADKDQYLKATNIDGVTRRITHNTYIYSTSTRRTSYQNKWKLYKGQTITTYGGSYKFKNGKSYFRIGGPSKQYVKSYNLGPVVKINTTSISNNGSSQNSSQIPSKEPSQVVNNTIPTVKGEETTVTVTSKRADLMVEVPDKDSVQPSGKVATKGEKFVVDRLEQGTRAATGSDGDDDWELAIYHIKGTNYWIYNYVVSAQKTLPVHSYYKTKQNLIQFTQPTDVYYSNGEKLNFHGDQIRKQSGRYKVDKLLYLWVPSENKAELFYHLVGKSAYSTNGEIHFSDGYVKANDVQYDKDCINQLTISNTSEEAEAAALKK